MKKFAVLLAMSLIPTICYAAAPAAPVFNAPVKVADGKIRNPNSKVAIDGTTVYAALEDCDYQYGNRLVRIAKSSNSGATWGLSAMPTFGPNYPADAMSLGNASIARVAVGIDPLYPTQKVVHAVWRNDANDTMYSFFSNRPNQVGWSYPVKINGSYVDGYEINIVTTSTGAVHVLLDNYYTTASSPDSAFTEPVQVTPAGGGMLVKDSKNNLYVATSYGNTVYFTKSSSGSSTWSAPVTVTTGTAITGYISLAVADSSTCYVGYADSTVRLAVSTNGGANWTNRTVAGFTLGDTDVAVAVTSAKLLTLVAQAGQDVLGNNILKVVRTNDNGVTWSKTVTIQADGDPTVQLDANNKAMILVRDGQGGQDWFNNRTNSNANILFIKEK